MLSLPEGVDCIAAMGRFFFTDAEENYYALPTKGGLAEALRAYEEMFGGTYGPWCFTRTGAIVRDW